MNAPRFLCVHQGYELYGSDRMFVSTLRAIRKEWPQAHITVHLPQEGLILGEIAPLANEIVLGNLWVFRQAHFRLRYWKNILQIPEAFGRAINLSRTHDVVYVNTVTVVGYLLASLFSRKKFLIHMHEIPTGWKARVFNAFLSMMNIDAIAISNAVARAFLSVKKITVVPNGVPEPRHIRQETPFELPFKLLLIGRINAWKGHHLALDAFKILKSRGHNVQMRFVGSAFEGQEHYHQDLLERISREKLQKDVEIFAFDPKPDFHYHWADILLVPSTSPEPFGLVAVEAMAHSIPVIAANHGGLTDIVVDQQTGRLFQPRDAQALADAIEYYVVSPGTIAAHGKAARQRFVENFREDRYCEHMVGVLRKYVK